MPWKNGLGVTEEVMAHPPGSDIAGFGWRLSIAHVGADGPFSVFAGIERTIALLDGEGLYLDLPERTVELSPGGDPFAFSGDLEISSRNRGGETIDLNVMTRRGQFRHAMRRITAGSVDIRSPDTILVFNGSSSVSHRSGHSKLGRFDTLVANPGDGPLSIEADAGTSIFLIEIIAWS